MARVQGTRVRPQLSGSRRFRFSTWRYHQIWEMGVFRSQRVELLDGEIWERETPSPPHSTSNELLKLAVHATFGDGHCYRVGQTLDLGRFSQPEPDLVVVAGKPRDFTSHPTDALLVAEIGEATLKRDRTLKARIYAKAALADYWIVNLVDRQLEVHRKPGPDPSHRGRFAYAEITLVPADGSIAPLAAPDRPIAVADLLP